AFFLPDEGMDGGSWRKLYKDSIKCQRKSYKIPVLINWYTRCIILIEIELEIIYFYDMREDECSNLEGVTEYEAASA
ncbi:MAG: hypothetical protein Q4G52_09085, partial [Clostridia bacterium]|nr:hypothetical protein [Clostridia bacterium]